MKTILALLIMAVSGLTIAQDDIYSFSFKNIEGDTISFEQFKGKKILIVNTASECGFTPQYKELQSLHEKQGDKVVVIGFPANNFGAQEPGTEKDIATFCEKNYGVTFLLASKVSVKGSDINELFAWLIQQKNDSFDGDIKWNFEKILIDEQGHVTARFRSQTKPDSEKIIKLL
jgi:glutathione peroxidase